MEKFIKWLKFSLECVMCAVKYVWLAVRVPLSLPIAGILAFCWIVSIPIWFLMACVTDNSVDELVRDFRDWYASPVVDYWYWCMKIADPCEWSRPAQNLLVNFPRD